MIEPISWLTVIGLSLIVTIRIMTWWTKLNDEKQKKKVKIDENIEKAQSFDDFVRINDELRNK